MSDFTLSNREHTTWFNSLLALERLPVGVKLLASKKAFKEQAFEERTAPKAYCTMVRDAGNGVAQKMSGLHFACLGSAGALGMIERSKADISGARRVAYGGCKNLAISRSLSKHAVFCENAYYGVAVGPLDVFHDTPDIVILITLPFYAMRIVHGFNYTYGQNDGFDLVGLGAICHESTAIPFEKNKLNLSLMCPGTKMLCQWHDSELAVSMPYHYVDGVLDGILQTVNPFERDARKRVISERLKQNGLDTRYEIQFGKNYDSGAYRGLSEEQKNIFISEKENE